MRRYGLHALSFVLLCLCGTPALALSRGTPQPAPLDPAALTLPSGQTVSLLETRAERGGALSRLRFVAPDLADPAQRPDFDALTGDLLWLCEEAGLKTLLADAETPAQIIVSLSAQPVEFGVQSPEIEQVFESYSVQGETCILEMF